MGGAGGKSVIRVVVGESLDGLSVKRWVVGGGHALVLSSLCSHPASCFSGIREGEGGIWKKVTWFVWISAPSPSLASRSIPAHPLAL